jgi:formylglycine-generating enzyme required for sulfatase activity
MTHTVNRFVFLALFSGVICTLLLPACPSSPPPTGPEAAFGASVTSGFAPLTVDFSDQSTAGSEAITSWHWDFGDGETSTKRTPSHKYIERGSYDVSLTVKTAIGTDTESRPAFITVSLDSADIDEQEGTPGQTLTIMLPGDVPLDMVWIPAGSFLMGRYPDEEDSNPAEDPQHRVTLSYGFWMGRYEVTYAQWRSIKGGSSSSDDSNRPVTNISLSAAHDFIDDLNKATERMFWLPSEAEWEYACRAGTTTRFYWGDDLDLYEVDYYAWWQRNNSSQTHDVGGKLPNAWGLYDMIGNVGERVEDDWHESYDPVIDSSHNYVRSTVPTDGRPWVYTASGYRDPMARGEVHWNGPEGAPSCRSAWRQDWMTTSDAEDFRGFRLIKYCGSSVPAGHPSVVELKINDGASSTLSRTVTLNINCVGRPLEYMASESADFEGARWKEYKEAPLFIFASAGNGTKTVHFKVRNDYGESLPLSDTITLNEGADGAEQTFMLPGNVPLVMVWIPAGSFMMGRYASEFESDGNEDPQHLVVFSSGFWIGKYEVTQSQWQAIMGSNPSYYQGASYGNTSNWAVESVTWDMIQSFINGLNTATGRAFRLPSETEWEYACRAGTTTRYYWGEDIAEEEIDDYAWTWTWMAESHEVGTRLPNPWGLYDMSGNVGEWCEDDWHNLYLRIPRDGRPWVDSPRGSSRVERGYALCDQFGCDRLRSAARDEQPLTRKIYLGFRLAMSAGGDTPGEHSIIAFSIDNDAASTSSRVVTLNSTCTGNPTEYMASESASFMGAVWQEYTQAPFLTITSAGNGIKTVYFKVRNSSRESGLVSDTILLNEGSEGTEETIMLPGNVPVEMVWIPAGTFMMGRSSDDDYYDSGPEEDPQHEVTLTSGFWMGKYEVTQAQWQSVMGSNPSYFQGNAYGDTSNCPVEHVSWVTVQDFLTRLNVATGRTFRLPSEAEWEYACRAGSITQYYWGINHGDCVYYAWCLASCTNECTTHDVGLKLPNAWGLYDMIGNVSEWCDDDWHNSYEDAPTDGRSWVDSPPDGSFNGGSGCIIRGDYWAGYDLRSACRSWAGAMEAYEYEEEMRQIGFRLVR